MLFSVEIIEELEKVDPQIRSVLIKILKLIEKAIGEVVKREDFLELKKEVHELSIHVKELAEAQKQTEKRLNELAEAQKQTEKRLNELAEAQRDSERRIERLERAVEELIHGLAETRQMVGNLSDTVGYTLEDRAMKSLPQLLSERFGITVKGRLVRKYVQYNGKYNELNIYGEGEKEGEKLTILGEAKSRLSKNNIDNFTKLIDKLKKKGIISGEVFLLVVTYTTPPEVEQYSLSKGVHVIWSYEV